MLLCPPEPWEGPLLAKLNANPLNEETILELFDRVAPELWGYALHRTGQRRTATPIVIDAFLTAAQHPAIFADRRVSIKVRMLMLIHLATDAPPTVIDSGRSKHRCYSSRRPSWPASDRFASDGLNRHSRAPQDQQPTP
ncbi:MAG: hypothetical protein ABIP33_12075 [Pseudolysinimonas sp.]